MIWQFLTFGRKGKLTFITSVPCRLTISNIWIKKRKINSPLHLSPVIWPYPTSGERKWKFTFITSVLSHLAIFNIKRNEKEIIFDTTVLCHLVSSNIWWKKWEIAFITSVLCHLTIPNIWWEKREINIHLSSVIWPFPTSEGKKGKPIFLQVSLHLYRTDASVSC